MRVNSAALVLVAGVKGNRAAASSLGPDRSYSRAVVCRAGRFSPPALSDPVAA